MNARSCCRQATHWLAPSVGLALIPKCPMCVAAYVAMISGVSISFSAAAWLRLGLVALCLGALMRLLVRMARQLMRRKSAGN
jgi:hypothetical protein